MISEVCCAIIGIHMATAHIDADMPMNSSNPGIYVQTIDNIVVGTYYNSIKRQSTYVGYMYNIANIDIMVGAITGYTAGVITPAIIPSIKLGGVRITFLPKMNITASNVVHFSIEKEFK